MCAKASVATNTCAMGGCLGLCRAASATSRLRIRGAEGKVPAGGLIPHLASGRGKLCDSFEVFFVVLLQLLRDVKQGVFGAFLRHGLDGKVQRPLKLRGRCVHRSNNNGEVERCISGDGIFDVPRGTHPLFRYSWKL